MCHSLFIPVPLESHLDCFQFGVITNKAAINHSPKGFCVNIKFSFLLGRCLGMGFLSDMINVGLTYGETDKLFFPFLRTAVISDHDGLKQQKSVLSKFGDQKSKIKVLAGPCSL